MKHCEIFLHLILIPALTFAASAHSIVVELGQVSGFEFCNQLDGSVFDMNSQIAYWHVRPLLLESSSDKLRKVARRDGSSLLSETIDIFPEAIDLLASKLHKRLLTEELSLMPTVQHYKDAIRPPPDPESARRFACFVAAEGTFSFAVLVSGLRMQRILQFVDNQKYFGNQLSFAPLTIDQAQLELNLRAHVQGYIEPVKNENHVRTSANGKLAFVLMVHQNIENIKEILEDISKSESTVLVHVDGNNPELKRDLSKWLDSEYERGNYNRDLVRVMEKSFKGAWGHSSLVFIQLEAMFELLAMNDKWEYVINMSGYDILLVDHNTIYNQFSEYGNANWLTLENAATYIYRTSVLFAADLKKAGTLDDSFDRLSPIMHLHNSQWMTLSRSTVERIQLSPSAATFLAQWEFDEIPDERFMSNLLGTIAIYDGTTNGAFRFSITGKNLRYLDIIDQHAVLLDEDNVADLSKAVIDKGSIIARKIRYSEHPRLVKWIRECKKFGWRNLEIRSTNGLCSSKRPEAMNTLLRFINLWRF